MDEIGKLATHFRPDRDYRRQHEPGIGYVCPRSDKYGGREGVIPPGIAAQRGLIPKGMREVTNDTVSRRAKEAAAECRPDAERYAEYYGRGAREKAAEKAEAPVRARPPAPPAEDPAPAETPLPPRKPSRAGKAVKAAGVRAAPASRGPARGAAKAPARTPRVFPEPVPDAGDDDTLDGFYDGLRGFGYGTGESGGARRKPSPEAAAAGGGDVPAAPSPRVRGTPADDVADADETVDAPGGQDDLYEQIAAERDAERRANVELRKAVESLRLRVKAAEARKARPEEHATVRVMLGAAPEKVKIGGRDVLGDIWEAKVMGHLDASRDGSELVLTILDPEMGSEVLSQIQPGEVVVLTRAGRTPCTYAGVCDKIYGDSGSSDFITCIRLAVAAETEPLEGRP